MGPRQEPERARISKSEPERNGKGDREQRQKEKGRESEIKVWSEPENASQGQPGRTRAGVREGGTSAGKQQANRGHEDGEEHAEHTALHFLSWFKFNQNLSALIIPKMS